MKIRNVLAAFCAVALVASTGPAAMAAEEIPSDNVEVTESYNSNLDNFLKDMFEKPGYEILQDGETDVADDFYANMEENYQNGDYKAILDYMRENRISAYAPVKVVQQPALREVNPLSDVVGARKMHDEQLIYVSDVDGSNEDNFIWCILEATISYNATQRKITNARAASMTYEIAYHYNIKNESYYPDASSTGYSYTAAKADYWYGADVFVQVVEDDINPIPRFHFRVDSTRTFTASEVIDG